MSVLIDGQRPIGARARIVAEPVLRLRLCTSSEDANPAEILCATLNDLSDYSKPKSQGALLKAAVVCCGVARIGEGAPELCEQLMDAVGGGIEIESWSLLPQVIQFTHSGLVRRSGRVRGWVHLAFLQGLFWLPLLVPLALEIVQLEAL